MALQLLGFLAGAFVIFTPLVEPIAYLFSPSFRARTRARWAQGGRSRKIGEVGLWLVAWSLLLVAIAIPIAAWLRGGSV